jgi:hypothetical protein
MTNHTSAPSKQTSSINPQTTRAAQAPEAKVNPEKKRSRGLLNRSALDLPEHAGLDRSKFKYRWLSRAKIESRTDGWDPRGWEIHKDPATNQPFTNGDLILGRMPAQEVEDRKKELEEISSGRMQALLEEQKEQDAQLQHSVRKMGGKIKASIEYGED